MDVRTEHSGRIVVGVDGSASSLAALHWAALQAEFTGSAVEVVVSWEWPTNYGWALPYPAEYNPAEEARTMLAGILDVAGKDHPAVSFEATVAEGHPAPVLVDASRGADLLVVGCRGHGEIAGMLIGSVSEHCATSAHCPVLVLRDAR